MTAADIWAGKHYQPRRMAVSPLRESIWNHAPPDDDSDDDTSQSPGQPAGQTRIEYRMV
jgi:hypothetical protein